MTEVDVVRRVAGLLRAAPPRAGRTRVLAIDGRSGAGKTYLAAGLARELGAPVVPLEDLYGGWDGLERGIDLLVTEVLEPLAAGRAARVPALRLGCGAWAEPVAARPAGAADRGGGRGRGAAGGAFESVLVWLESPRPRSEEEGA